MDRQRLRALLAAVAEGQTSLEQAEAALSNLATGPLAYATVDLHRAVRTGHPEVIYGEGKDPDQIIGILGRLAAAGQSGIVTRVSPEKAEAVCAALPACRHHAVARVLHLEVSAAAPVAGRIAVICAGTSDLPVAEEAAVVAECVGLAVDRVRDVGVAGLHRVLDRLPTLREARVLIVVAGMEGALASVVAGLVDRPVLAVPTSVGYGASFGGLAALLAMLNACATGVSVLNIDNGFGAAMQAARILRSWEAR